MVSCDLTKISDENVNYGMKVRSWHHVRKELRYLPMSNKEFCFLNTPIE
jgi:hypothetical protein